MNDSTACTRPRFRTWLALPLLLSLACTAEARRDRQIRASIRSSVVWIRQDPGSPATRQAIATSWGLLLQQFPDQAFTVSTTLESLDREWPLAVQEGRPCLVAFAPRTVRGRGGGWQWTTTFWELAGHPATLDEMKPRIISPMGEELGFPPGSSGIPGGAYYIQPFDQGRHDWWCAGDHRGSAVTLTYWYQRGRVESRTKLE